jgi:hypothetical protein
VKPACHTTTNSDLVKQLRDVAKALAGHEVSVCADSHYISITGPVEVIDGLFAGGQLQEEEDEEEEAS